MGKFKRGQAKPLGSGRKPGSRNRVTVAVQEGVLQALNADAGAVAFFRKLKNSRLAEDRRTFAHLCARLIPAQTDLDVTVEGPSVVVTIPDNGRGPINGETIEQYKARMKRGDGNK